MHNKIWHQINNLRSWSKTQTLQLLNEDVEHDEHDENHGY